MGQRTNEIVDTECQPRPVELRLQAAATEDFPELEPPLRTMTSTLIRATVGACPSVDGRWRRD